MFKTSMILAGLLISTTFAADPATAPESGKKTVSKVKDLAWIKKELHEFRLNWDNNKGKLSKEGTSNAIQSMIAVFEVLKQNSTFVTSNPYLIEQVGNNFYRLGEREKALTAILLEISTLDPKFVGTSRVDEYVTKCLKLGALGRLEIASQKLRELIKNSSIDPLIRMEIIDRFYAINEDNHHSEAQEMWADLQLETGVYQTIEEAREAAKTKFPKGAFLQKLLKDLEESKAGLSAKAPSKDPNVNDNDSTEDYSDMPPLEK